MPGKGDSSDPTWNYIARALIRGRTFARSAGHRWKGDSCFVANAAALNLVIWTRNGASKLFDGGPSLEADVPACIELAYADHYLNMRAVTSATGPIGHAASWVSTEGYDAYKRLILGMQAMGNEQFPALSPNPLNPASLMPDQIKLMQMARAIFGSLVGPAGNALVRKLQENPNNPLSPVTEENSYWANLGRTDGLSDLASSNLGDEIRTMAKLLFHRP